jgi:LysW-gamma-L-lysine carboxypeptidase
VEEEGNSTGARHVLNEYQPRFAINGEPSSWDRCTLGYKGIAIADLTLRRPQAHTASGNGNAPEAAFGLWERIQEWAEDFNKDRARTFDQILVSLRGFSSGESDFEGWASLRVAARLPLECPPGSWYRTLRQLAPQEEVNETGFPIPAYLGEKNTPLVRAFLAGIRAQGGQPRFVVKTGTADLNLAAPAWGCPAVAYGPGDSNLDHTPNEHILLEDYQHSVDVLQGVLEQLME